MKVLWINFKMKQYDFDAIKVIKVMDGYANPGGGGFYCRVVFIKDDGSEIVFVKSPTLDLLIDIYEELLSFFPHGIDIDIPKSFSEKIVKRGM